MTAQRIRIAFLAVLALAPGVCMAQNPFVGTWKLDAAKSRLAGAIISFGRAAEQSVQLAAGGQKYSFRADGNLYRMASGDLASWKRIDANRWSTAYETPSGALFSSETWTLSPDGNRLTAARSRVGAQGATIPDETIYFVRTAGPTGTSAGSPTGSVPGSLPVSVPESLLGSLLGSWKSEKVAIGASRELVIQANGLGGMVLKFPYRQMTCFVDVEGKDVAPEGPVVPPGMTVALLRSGPSSFKWVEKMNGSTVSASVFALAADGQTLTEVGAAPGDPPRTAVWEKQ
jgi:hypothetical protein